MQRTNSEDRRQSMRKDNAPPVTKGNNNDNARLVQVELKCSYSFGVLIHYRNN